MTFCSQGGLCMMSLRVWLSGPMFLSEGSLCLVTCSFLESLSRGVSAQGGLCREVSVQGSLHPGGVSVQGVNVQGGLCPGVLCPEGGGVLCPGGVSVQGDLCTVKSRQYTSYWNALLCVVGVCPPVDVPHTTVNYTTSPVLDFYIAGTEAHVECESPLRLLDPFRINCRNDTHWISPYTILPVCASKLFFFHNMQFCQT